MAQIRFSTSLLAAVICLAPSAAIAQRQVSLLATVTKPDGTPITALDPALVRVTENGEAGKIAKVDPVDRVSKVQLLIDNGIGIPSESFADLKKGLRGLVEALPPNIETAIVTTAPQPRFIERGTADREKLLKSLDLIATDNGAGRFVEALYESTERIEKDKQDSSYVIMALASTSGDLRVRDGDVNKIMQRVSGGRIKVHVVVLSGRVGTTLSGGGAQLDIGEAAAKNSGGRFEHINAANRLATLLPEIGAEMAKALGPTSRQYRVTFERPGNASGELGKLTIGITGMVVSGVSIERR